MVREQLAGIIPPEQGFRWRGGEISRLEGFSDAVFAFALTLLVVSLEVPKTYHELIEAMRGFLAFAFCFALLAEVWYSHYRFFRRYGLQTPWAVFLNCALLFFVLFYVYPLKFLFVTVFEGGGRIEVHEARVLFVIYGLGYAAVFASLALLYRDAWKKRFALSLDEIERFKTRQSLTDHTAMIAVGLASTVLALLLPDRLVGLAGYFYLLIGAYFTLAGIFFGRRMRELQQKMNEEAEPLETLL
jgi:uncharacterized membrane protein